MSVPKMLLALPSNHYDELAKLADALSLPVPDCLRFMLIVHQEITGEILP